ncbi:MAG: glycosyltransferase [Lachnospiraceae bacterium]|nr:glycosyltransferase [Lachnospiraceae bacterium]
MISVIVPIYNVRPYIETCIDSILCQTYKELEILLVDDGSTDGCLEICEEYKKRDPRIQVLHKENGGIVSARKAGLCAAKGEYIAYVDGDDWIEPVMYERMLEILEEKNVDIVACGRYEDTGGYRRKVLQGMGKGYYDKRRMTEELYPQMIAGEKFFEWGISPNIWDKLFRRGCINSHQMAVAESIVMGEDAACVYPCLLHAESVYIMEDCLYHYRQTRTSTIKKPARDVWEYTRYKTLFQTADQFFTDNRHIYDLKKQWKRYMLFLMTPRADRLYKGIEKLDYLFPFPEVKKGSRIILYCAGTYGQKLHQYLKETDFCTIAAWTDRNFQELCKQGLSVEAPNVIAERPHDAIVIANMFAGQREEIYRELEFRYPGSRICTIDEKLIESNETMEAFGLMRQAE